MLHADESPQQQWVEMLGKRSMSTFKPLIKFSAMFFPKLPGTTAMQQRTAGSTECVTRVWKTMLWCQHHVPTQLWEMSSSKISGQQASQIWVWADHATCIQAHTRKSPCKTLDPNVDLSWNRPLLYLPNSPAKGGEIRSKADLCQKHEHGSAVFLRRPEGLMYHASWRKRS